MGLPPSSLGGFQDRLTVLEVTSSYSSGPSGGLGRSSTITSITPVGSESSTVSHQPDLKRRHVAANETESSANLEPYGRRLIGATAQQT